MSKKFIFSVALLALLIFLIPIEHKYDKLFRFFSLTLIPEGLEVSPQYEKKLYFYISDLIALLLLSIGLFWVKIPLRRLFGNLLWVVFFFALVSITTSPFMHYPVAYSRLLQLLTPVILVSFISNGCTEEEKGKVTNIILIAVVSAGLFQNSNCYHSIFQPSATWLKAPWRDE